MAENKKSFILYCDMIHTVEKLPDEKAGQLIKHILRYVNDQNPETDDLLLQIAFEPIKQQLKRDLRNWEEFKAKQSENGKLGGRPSKPKKPKPLAENQKNPSLNSESQKSLNATVNVNVNDTVILLHQKLMEEMLSDERKHDREQLEVSSRKFIDKKLLEKFNAHLSNTSMYHQTFAEYKKHLVYWIMKTPQLQAEVNKKYKSI